MAKQNPFRGGNVIVIVGELMCRSGAAVVKGQRFGRNESAIKTVSQRVYTKSTKENRKRIHALTSNQATSSNISSMTQSRLQPDMASDLRNLKRLSQLLVLGKTRSEEHTSELQSQFHLVCRL